MLLAAVRAVADGIVGDFAWADYGSGDNIQLTVWVLETLCLLVALYHGVWFL